VRIYDLLNAGERDLLFYLDRIGPAPQHIVDIGCGTGLFTRMLARHGHTVTGLDPAAAMLNYARSQPGAESVNWLHGTAEQLPADARFDVALMTGHAFQCLQSDDEVTATLRAIRRHLAPGGRLLFESRNPLAQAWRGWNAADSRRDYRSDDGEVLTVWHELGEQEGEWISFASYYRFADGEMLVSASTLRFMPQPEIARRLAQAGFTQVDFRGDWEGAPYRDDSPAIIVLAG
jgi:ubiquinone/menaquinone biosynthesis C-methylase UbiE